MKNKKNTKKNIWIYLLAGFVFLSIGFGVIFFFSFGNFLSPQDKLEKSDVVIAVSGGETYSRAQKAIDIYQEGWAKKIIFSGAARSGDISNAKAMQGYALKRGVSATDIFIEEKSTSTYENASNTKEIIEKNNFKKIILVTSPYHQRRVYMNFRYVLGPDYKIINQSSSDNYWSSSDWSGSKKNIKTSFDEFSKIIYLFFTKDYSREVN